MMQNFDMSSKTVFTFENLSAVGTEMDLPAWTLHIFIFFLVTAASAVDSCPPLSNPELGEVSVTEEAGRRHGLQQLLLARAEAAVAEVARDEVARPAEQARQLRGHGRLRLGIVGISNVDTDVEIISISILRWNYDIK